MRILLVGCDRRTPDLLRDVLAGRGWEVVRAADAGRAAEELARRRFEVVVVDGELAEQVAHLDMGGARLWLLVDRACTGAEVRRAAAHLGAEAVFRRPLPLLDVVDRLGAQRPPAGAASGGSTAGAGDLHEANAARIARVWAERRSGLLRWEPAPGERPRTARIAHGGPVGEEDAEVLRGAMRGGRVEFVERAVEGTGDPWRLGRLLHEAVRNPQKTGFARRYARRVARRTRLSDAVRFLPVGDAARAVVQEADGRTPLAGLVRRVGADLDEVGVDLHLLRRLGLLELGPPTTSRSAREGGPPTSETRTSSSGIRGRGPGAAASSRRGLGRALRADRAEARLRAARLEAELRRIEGAPPPVVLGIPADAPEAMLDEAHRRMVERYERFARDPTLPEHGRDAARRILELVHAAARRMAITPVQPVLRPTHGPAAAGERGGWYEGAEEDDTPTDVSGFTSGAGDDTPEDLLRRGRTLMARGRWAEADRVLTRARDLRLDHPQVLANLAWARWRNEARPLADRREDARDLLALAEQFDGRDPEVAEIFARFLLEVGDPEAALPRARRAFRADPTHPERRRLYEKVAALLGDDGPPSTRSSSYSR